LAEDPAYSCSLISTASGDLDRDWDDAGGVDDLLHATIPHSSTATTMDDFMTGGIVNVFDPHEVQSFASYLEKSLFGALPQ
jgi:hypothetical protein